MIQVNLTPEEMAEIEKNGFYYKEGYEYGKLREIKITTEKVR